MSEKIIRQCPFCLAMPNENGKDGNPVLELTVHSGVAFVVCKRCLARGPLIDRIFEPKEFEGKAITAWNYPFRS